jgi:hypothetical protein
MPESAYRRMARGGNALPLGIFTGGCLLVIAVHPDRFSGWALWALGPEIFYLAYLLAFRTPPEDLRVGAASAVVVGYSAGYGLVAGLGDESYTDIARLVYLFLPALGLAAMLACLVIVEFIAAFVGVRSASLGSEETAATTAAPTPGHALLVAALVMGGWATFAMTGWGSPKVAVAEDGDGGVSPLVAEVRCDGNDTHLLTPTVVTRRDGVHVRINNRSGGEVELEYEIDGGSGGGGGELVPAGVSERLISFPAETIGVACREKGRSSPSKYATMKVIDPGDKAKSPQVECGQGTSEYRDFDAVSDADPLAAARSYMRDRHLLRPGDVLEKAVGPGPEFPVVLLLRNGRAVASLWFSPGADGQDFALNHVTVCKGI